MLLEQQDLKELQARRAHKVQQDQLVQQAHKAQRDHKAKQEQQV